MKKSILRNRFEYNKLRLEFLKLSIKGGEGSGNFGHAGRPGEVGGSSSSGGSVNIRDGITSAPRFREIAEIARSQFGDNWQYNKIGIRVQTDTFGEKEGEVFQHESLHWIDGDMTTEGTGGVSAIDIDTNFDNFTARQSMNYEGNVIFILGSKGYEEGADYGEVVMINPVILKIIDDRN